MDNYDLNRVYWDGCQLRYEVHQLKESPMNELIAETAINPTMAPATALTDEELAKLLSVGVTVTTDDGDEAEEDKVLH